MSATIKSSANRTFDVLTGFDYDYSYRRTVYHGLVVHYDNDGVRTIFQAVYVHCSRSDTAFHICRRTVAECG